MSGTRHARISRTERDWTAEGRERKHAVLSQRAASVAAGIADAIVTKDGPLYFVSRPDGDVPLADGHAFGLYFHDCRYLSGHELRLGGQPLRALAASAGEGFRAVLQFTNPPMAGAGKRVVAEETLSLKVVRTLNGGGQRLNETISIHNYAVDPVVLFVELAFQAGFEDIFAIRGLWRERPGQLRPPAWSDGNLRFAYDGADGVLRVLAVDFDPAPTEADGHRARFKLKLDGRGDRQLRAVFTVTEELPIGESQRRSGHLKSRDTVGGGDRWLADATRVDSNSVLLNAILDRSLRDIQALRTRMGDDDYLAAGVPWFVTLFGRDALITAYQVLSFDPAIAAHTLRLLAARQGSAVNEWRDEEPGKILHELRIGELARLGCIPHTPYYGTVDATPLFLILLAAHARWTGSMALFEELRDAVEGALAWMTTFGDRDGDGYVEYRSALDKGLANQGWKDSGDAIVNADGSLGRPPISMVEVQGYAYAARMEIAELYERAGDAARAGLLRATANTLRERLNRDFWMGDRSTYALALQEGGAPCRVISSNPGHLLWNGAADQAKADSTAKVLMAPDMFSGWGIRTLSTRERRHNPLGYHLGTIWPHDNDLIAAGFRRYGLDDDALRLCTAILEAAMSFDEYRLPEAFAGYQREAFGGPVRYPVACHPQAWAAGTPPHMLQTLLGLEPDAFSRRLRIIRPILPEFIDRLELRQLRVGDATVDLTFERKDSGIGVHTTRLVGELEVQIVESP